MPQKGLQIHALNVSDVALHADLGVLLCQVGLIPNFADRWRLQLCNKGSRCISHARCGTSQRERHRRLTGRLSAPDGLRPVVRRERAAALAIQQQLAQQLDREHLVGSSW